MEHQGAELGQFYKVTERRANKTNRYNQNLSGTNSQPLAKTKTPHEIQLFDPEIFFSPLKACTDAEKRGLTYFKCI